MERVVIVAYKPLAGKEADLMELTQGHWDRLNEEGLVSERKPIVIKAKDGCIVEVFGWKSEKAIARAHSNPAVQQMWTEFAEVCEYIPVGQLAESQNLFSDFSPVN